MKSQCSWTRVLPQQVLDNEEHQAKVCQVWKNQPHDAESLAWGEEPKQKGKGQKSKNDSSGKKKVDKKVKGKEKAQTSANVLTVLELADLSIQTAQSIDFSCYKTSEKVEWCLDSGCTVLKRNIGRCYSDLKPNVPLRNCIGSLRSQDLCK